MAVSNDPSQMFASPIAGASLTKTPNSAPWQQKTQFTDLNDALMYMWDTVFKDPDTVLQILAFLRKGITITEITNTFLFTGIAGGKWNLDLALLMYQTVAHQIEVVAKLRKVKYTFKRINPSTAKFIQDFKEYIVAPDDEPIEKFAKKKMFATGLGLDKEVE